MMGALDRRGPATALALLKLRRNPPTTIQLLFRPNSLPLLAIAAVITLLAVWSIDAPIEVPYAIGGACLGAALRDWGMARKTVSVLPVQAELLIGQRSNELQIVTAGNANWPG